MVCEESRRVAARYLQAQEDEQILDAMADHVADIFLDTLAKYANFDEKEVAQVLERQGVDAEILNKIAPAQKEAGLGQVVKVLGGLVARGLWHVVVGPFQVIGKLLQSSQFRLEVKASFRRALSHEIRSTKHMIGVARRLAAGEEVNTQERKAALHQLLDLLSKAVLIYFAGPHVVGLFKGGVWKALAAILSPLDEIVLILLDKPLRAVVKKLIAADIGLLPSGFYTHF
jgi:hypothetical protein